MMTDSIRFTDKGGQFMVVNAYQGIPYYRGKLPLSFAEHMTRMKNMAVQDDDVLVCGYPKSGNHWLWEMVSMIVNGDVQYREHLTGINFLEFRPMEHFESLASPRVFGSNGRYDVIPSGMADKGTKIVHVCRNPKSIAVSFYNMLVGIKEVNRYNQPVRVEDYKGTWPDFLDLFLKGQVPYGSWFEHTRDWESHYTEHPIHRVQYEDMMKNPTSTIQQLSEFLEHPVSKERADEIREACSFSKQKAASQHCQHDVTSWHSGQQQGMYRTGKADDWKDWFTEKQNKEFEKVYEEVLKIKYQF